MVHKLQHPDGHIDVLIDNGIYSSLSNVKKNNQLKLNISTNYINLLLSAYNKQLKFKHIDFINQKNIQIETNYGFWTPIKIEKKECVEERVYNFEVEKEHTYIANNIVTHNCMAFMQVMFQIQEEELGKEYTDKNENKITEIVKALDKFYKRN